MTGDQRIGTGTLAKVLCVSCGVIANRDQFTAADVELLYGEAYELNTLGREEHMFYTAAGPVARSQAFCDWIMPHVPETARRLVEIGCGEGRLLEKLQQQRPSMAMCGLDGSRRAVALGRARGLDIHQQLLLGGAPLEPADVLLLVNVIEHVEDIPGVMAQLTDSLRPGGRIIFCLPIQDYGGYDMFFAEHVWHVTALQFHRIAARHGLRVLASDTEHPVNHGIGLFVCEVAGRDESAASATNVIEVIDQGDLQRHNLSVWQQAFERVDQWLDSRRGARLAVFGGGEVYTLFVTFTTLGDGAVVACIDDTKPEGTLKHGVPVHPTAWLATHPVDALLLAVNRKYHDMVMAKVAPYGVTVYPLVT